MPPTVGYIELPESGLAFVAVIFILAVLATIFPEKTNDE